MKQYKSYFRTCQIIVATLVVGLVAGCSDLEEKPYSFISSENFYQTEEDALAALNAAYAVYPVLYEASTMFTVTELPADNVTIHRNATFIGLDDWTIPADHPFVTNFWNANYRLISAANIVLGRVPQIEMDQGTKNEILAEAHFIRAHAYFTLVRLFGSVPVHTEELQGQDGISKPKSPVDDIYGLIIDDLATASNGLPVSRDASQFGRATRGAALAMLSWVHLTTNEFEQARDYANDVMELGRYELLDDFVQVFDQNNETNNEIIFSVQYDGAIVGSNLASFCHAFGPSNPLCFSGVQVFQVDEQSPMWTERDFGVYRTANTVYDELVLEDGELHSVYDTSRPYPAFRKYIAIGETGQSNCPLNPIVLRYADILFMYAEADNELNGPTTETLEMVNQIIRRAHNLPLNQASAFDIDPGISQTDFKQVIVEQRNLEFVMEGKRIYDLLRLNIFKSTLQDLGKPATAGDLFPIPQAEINANDALTQEDQNPGY
ncbi:Starch-binding associating with outer membrane [Flagellimonas taeanensis]|uniref:Starch-binding associating with outer membrane n=1 Tax=Flagellimonas taeanensis TaxID=1005926 RepID=A0A1M6Z8A9_9FLAO|nr:RagB/SusD family nutrient uptake outer membrane protein [Allomuricauda taeanensis]SFC10963.1 Starch-binding associating with outer membrane [Allomuricauda taeanensis]SHL26691.1 Starch-binding associating with outer membrane [Allomuricauda taeanensis]